MENLGLLLNSKYLFIFHQSMNEILCSLTHTRFLFLVSRWGIRKYLELSPLGSTTIDICPIPIIFGCPLKIQFKDISSNLVCWSFSSIYSDKKMKENNIFPFKRHLVQIDFHYIQLHEVYECKICLFKKYLMIII